MSPKRCTFFLWVCLTLPHLQWGGPCVGGSGTWTIEVPFAAAALWAAGQRRVRFVAQHSGAHLAGPKAMPVGGETGFKEWESEDLMMAEPIVYGIRNAVLALEGCEEGRTSGACPSIEVGMRLLERLLKLDKHVVDSYDYYRQRARERPSVPASWLDVVSLLHRGGEVEKVLKNLGTTRVDLEKSTLNGAPGTCQVRLPPADGSPAVDPGVVLRDGLGKMPLLGFATAGSFSDWRQHRTRAVKNASDTQYHRKACVRAVGWALEAGFRYVDTAQDLDTQDCIGHAVSKSDIMRKDMFVATKLSEESDYWRQGSRVRAAFDHQINELRLEHVDLYLQQHPSDASDGMKHAWRSMEILVAEGRVHALGVAGHPPDELALLEKHGRKGTKPAVAYQKWDVYHRGVEERETRRLASTGGIHLIGTGSIQGKPFELSCIEDPIVKSVAARVNHTAAQVCLRFVLQNGLGVIVMSRRRERIVENLDVFRFELPDAEMQILNSLVYGARAGWQFIEGVSDALGYSSIHQYAREEL